MLVEQGKHNTNLPLEREKTVTYTLPLEVILKTVTEGLIELHAANSAEPYDHDRYSRADCVILSALAILSGGDTEIAESIREDLRDWSGESVGGWFIANWMQRRGWAAQAAAEAADWDAKYPNGVYGS